MLPPPRLSNAGRTYVSAVIVGGFLVLTGSGYRLFTHPIGYQWFLLAALTLISGSATVKLPSVPASISISETFVFAAVLLYGPAAGTVTVALDGLVISYWIAKRRRQPYRALFNMSAPAVSAWCSAHLFFWVAGIAPLVQAPATLDRILPALFLFAISYFGINSGLIAIAISLETRLAPFKVWRENFLWLSLNYFCGASVAVLLVVYTRRVDMRFIGAIVPLLLVLYFTFKISMDRVEDANRHVEKINNLYLSTIETLAMAVDAKDQVTHGHIRRVQGYAIGLAHELGVRDQSLIKAIETAALLHDMGKLAVPEYILNKPGRLTEAEFDKMKIHATVGAEILSAIEFPYPVVPIVRHHHESWDGSGYPDGLKGTEIPIGARILAVVDCFDALTSDRPYRPKLSDEDALKILDERRGTMYDPLIIHTFQRVYKELEVSAQHYASRQAPGLGNMPPHNAITPGSKHQVGRARMSAADTSSPALVDAATVFAHAAVTKVRDAISATLYVFYSYDSARDEIVATHVWGDRASEITGLRISMGERLSGWVGANRQTIVNSDASLDLGGSTQLHTPQLRSCLSTPVVNAGALIGVMSLYSNEGAAFSDRDGRTITRIWELVCSEQLDAHHVAN